MSVEEKILNNRENLLVNDVDEQKFTDFELTEKITNEAGSVEIEGDSLLAAVDKNSGLTKDEIEDVRRETGVVEKLNEINKKIKELASVAKEKLRKIMHFAPSMNSDGGGFTPEDELEKVKKSSKAEKREALNDFYEKYFYQKNGLAHIQADITEIIQKNPDISIEEILHKKQKQFKQYGLTSEQKGRIKEVLQNYQVKHEAVADYISETKDPVELFEKIFKFKPSGDIKLIKGPVSIGFSCEDVEDYANARMGKGNVGNIDDYFLKSNYGVCLQGVPDLDMDVVLINRTTFKNVKNSDNIEAGSIRHEEQHAINQLFYKNPYNQEEMDEKITKAVMENDPAKKEQSMNRYLRAVMKNNEFRAIDEIIARYKDGMSNPSALKVGMGIKAVDGGDYDFMEPYKQRVKKQLLQEMGKDSEVFIDKCINDVLNKEYNEMVNQAIDLIFSIRKDRNNTTDSIIALFQNEPMEKWSKIIKRNQDYFSNH